MNNNQNRLAAVSISEGALMRPSPTTPPSTTTLKARAIAVAVGLTLAVRAHDRPKRDGRHLR